jgi:hypothetical protein
MTEYRGGVDPRVMAGWEPRPAPPGEAAARPPGELPSADANEDAAEADDVTATGAVAAGETGQPAVDAALGELADAERLPPDQQVAAYESVHRTLQETLRSVEQA